MLLTPSGILLFMESEIFVIHHAGAFWAAEFKCGVKICDLRKFKMVKQFLFYYLKLKKFEHFHFRFGLCEEKNFREQVFKKYEFSENNIILIFCNKKLNSSRHA